MDEPGPNESESRKPVRRHPRPVLRPAQQSHSVLAVGLIILGTAAGGFLVLAKARMHSTAGARVSTRLQWERREAELDQIISQAESEGKLRNPEAGTGASDERR